VEGPLEADHRVAPGEGARELDRVLDGLGAGVEERRLRRAGERRKCEQTLREVCVHLVRDDREVGMRELLELLLRGGDDVRVRVPDVQAADPTGEIDEDVAVDIGDRRATRLCRNNREGDRKRRGDARGEALEHGGAAWSGHGGLEANRPGGGHSPRLAQALAGLHI
jgi:hypothetical protein